MRYTRPGALGINSVEVYKLGLLMGGLVSNFVLIRAAEFSLDCLRPLE